VFVAPRCSSRDSSAASSALDRWKPSKSVHQLAQMPAGSDEAGALLFHIDASLEALKHYL